MAENTPLSKKIIVYAISVAASVCLAVAGLVAGIGVAGFSKWFYEHEFSKNGTYERVDMPKDELMRVVNHMLEYMCGGNDDLNVKAVVGGSERWFFSQIEVDHMVDVKNLISFAFGAAIVSIVVFALVAAMFISKALRDNAVVFLKTLILGAEAALAVLALFAILAAANFDGVFEGFHKIFFSNDNWILDSRVDLLVNIVPTEFFTDAAILAGVVFGIILVLTIFASVVILGRVKPVGAVDGEVDGAVETDDESGSE